MVRYMYGTGYYIGTYWLMGYPYQYSSLVVMFKETFEMPDMSSQLANTIQLHRIGSATLR